ncbi:MAG: sigma-54 dependent transcriptional regulator [Brumimicrobium sp.]
MKRILIVDDDVDICTLLKRFLERNNFKVDTAFKGSDGVLKANQNKYDVILTDFRLPDMDGIEVLRAIKKIDPSIPVIIITGYSDVSQAVKVIRLGAFEYVTKPIYPEEILIIVQNALESSEKQEKIASKNDINVQKTIIKSETSEYLFGKSPSSQKIQRMIELVAPTDMTVVVLGESGTGKEVVARMIHQNSNRSQAPFVPVDCGALPKELAGSELFGHEKGAYTGAVNSKRGHFEMANGGTLFLDEIGNLSYENQVKLLRVLQERAIRRMGSEKDIPVDVRIIVATNEDLKKAISRGNFREDIYFRINEFNIELPPLNGNIQDLKDYVDFFLKKSNEELGKRIESIDDEVMQAICNYSWPGNIREIKNVMKRLVLLTTGSSIKKDVLPNEILNPNSVSKFGEAEKDLPYNLKSIVEIAESKAILRALEATNFNKSKCAELLGVDRKTLYNKMNAYGLI